VTLPPKALQSLVDFKSKLLSIEAPVVIKETGSKPEAKPVISEAPKKGKREPKPFTTMRHARMHGEAWQRYKRKGGW
jgi:hypothetical protein